MDRVYLLKLGELTLKLGNKSRFENRLKEGVKDAFAPDRVRVIMKDGRFYVECPETEDARAEEALSRVFGLAAYARAARVEKEMGQIREAALAVAREAMALTGGTRFKVEARRSDKSFPLDSYGIASSLGEYLLDSIEGLSVKVREPDWTLNVEIREKAFVYGVERRGERGLPRGSSGKGLLLLSGGIDSPVSGYLMAKRGLELEAIHFHSYPFTSVEAQEKVERLAAALARYVGPINLHIVPFTELQSAIKKAAPEDHRTLLLRAAMVLAADLVAKERNLGCLVSGESLGQVASQTMYNMRLTGSYTDLPLFRPLVGTDKEDTIRIAKKIGTYDISIEPFEDCCVLFSPTHPVLRAPYEKTRLLWSSLDLEGIIEQAVRDRKVKRILPSR
jgi:tRNA uracil 4-sulfurtransferase